MPDMQGSNRVQELVDRMDIQNCVNRLARGMDRHDGELMASAYHPDAWDDHGVVAGAAVDFIRFLNGSEDAPGNHEMMFRDHMHIMGNHLAEIDGDEAHAETYFILVASYRNGSGSGLWTGRYIDRLERRDGRWAISARQVIMGTTADLGPEMMSAEQLAGFAKGSWDRSDPSYMRPLRLGGEDKGHATVW